MKFTKLINKIIDFIRKKIQDPISYSRHLGVTIGEHCVFCDVPVWSSEPYLIQIGNHVHLSFECAFITHDGGRAVCQQLYPDRFLMKFGRIKVEDNVFIGARAMILPGITIGKNSVIAAGAVVCKNVPPNEVWGGCPAHFIMTTEDYAQKSFANSPKYNPNIQHLSKKEKLLNYYYPEA